MAEELLQNVIDIMDHAHTHKVQLSELLDSLQEAEDQVKTSATNSREQLQNHFDKIKSKLNKVLDLRLTKLLERVQEIEEGACTPLRQCREMINSSMDSATRIMQEGKDILSGNPTENVDKMVKLKDNADIKTLNSVPAVPTLCDVAHISVQLSDSLQDKLVQMITNEGKVWEKSPVQIVEAVEQPGGILLKWSEIEDDGEGLEYRLEYRSGTVPLSDANVTFQTAYTGTDNSFCFKGLTINKKYSFRVHCRHISTEDWSPGSLPFMASTSIPPYQWSNENDSYLVTCDSRIACRKETGLTNVLYSASACYSTGHAITFRIIEGGETTPFDCIGLAFDRDCEDTLQREQAFLVAITGSIFVDGHEMKTKLPPLKKGSVLVFMTENLSNGKIRVSVELEEKMVTFDWKSGGKTPTSPVALMGMAGGLGMMGLTANGSEDAQISLYFGMKFSHEGWTVIVE